MTMRILHGGAILGGALALVLVPGVVRAQRNDRDHDGDRDHHSQQWRNRHRAPVWYFSSGREPYGWSRGRKMGWRDCADLPPGLARQEGCWDHRGYGRWDWSGNRYRHDDDDWRADRGNWHRREFRRDRDRDRDRHHRGDRGHDRDD